MATVSVVASAIFVVVVDDVAVVAAAAVVVVIVIALLLLWLLLLLLFCICGCCYCCCNVLETKICNPNRKLMFDKAFGTEDKLLIMIATLLFETGATFLSSFRSSHFWNAGVVSFCVCCRKCTSRYHTVRCYQVFFYKN